MKFHIIHFTLLPLLLASCVTVQQEQEKVDKEVAVLNQEIAEREYARIVRLRDEEFAGVREKLAQATKAAVVRERGDCCCTGAELDPISPCPLSKKEFESVMKLLAQAKPEPAPTRESIQPEKLASVTWDKETGWTTNIEPAPVPILLPWNNLLIDKLQLMDARGEQVLSISFDHTRREKDKVKNDIFASWGVFASEWRNLWVELPGDAYTQFLNHPARLRFKKKVDAADK
jgi:hypothetical protein